MIKQTDHRRALEKIAANPSKYGFENTIAIAMEVNLFDKTGRQVAQPDLVLYDTKGEITIVEYKNNGDQALIERAQEQLYNAVDWFSKNTGISPKMALIDGTRYPELRRIR